MVGGVCVGPGAACVLRYWQGSDTLLCSARFNHGTDSGLHRYCSMPVVVDKVLGFEDSYRLENIAQGGLPKSEITS